MQLFLVVYSNPLLGWVRWVLSKWWRLGLLTCDFVQDFLPNESGLLFG